MSDAIEPEPLWDVVEEHLDEAEFLWSMWEHSLVAPNYTLDEVAEGPEERLLAHIDGLVVNGPLVARRLLIPALEDEDPGRVSAAAAALLLGPASAAGLEAILEVGRELPEQRAPLAHALGCVDVDGLLGHVRKWLAEPDSGLVAVAAEVLAFHFKPIGETLGLLLAGDDPAERALALRALVHEPEPGRYMRAVQSALQELHPTVLDAAIEAGVRLGLPAAWARACERASDADGGASLLLLGLRGEAGDQAKLLDALADRKRRATALRALGYLGTAAAVDASLEWLDDKALGPLAGEVFTAVTGVDLEDENMTSDLEDEDEATDHTPEDDLPRPNPMLVLQWWMNHRSRFAEGRYTAGAPRDKESLERQVLQGAMRRRGGALLGLELLTKNEPRYRIQVRAPTRRQRTQMQALLAGR